MCRLTPYAYAVVLEPEVTMFASNPRDALAFAHEHARRLRDEATVERLSRRPWLRRGFAASLRSAANRIDPAPLAHRPA